MKFNVTWIDLQGQPAREVVDLDDGEIAVVIAPLKRSDLLLLHREIDKHSLRGMLFVPPDVEEDLRLWLSKTAEEKALTALRMEMLEVLRTEDFRRRPTPAWSRRAAQEVKSPRAPSGMKEQKNKPGAAARVKARARRR